MPRFRSILDTMPAYKPGKAVVSPDGRSYKLSSNESPFGPLPSVVEAIARAATEVHRYPDPGAVRLTETLAERFGVPYDHVALGAGSVAVAQQILEAVGEPGADVMYAWRSFEAYPLLVGLSGANAVEVPLRDETHDLDAMADAITPATRLVFVCNPNNPTGTVNRADELTRFLDRVPENVTVVLDEAYREYVRDADVPDGLTLYRERPNVAVLRTFSKAYGLAGLRVGYLIGQEPVAAAVRKTLLPFAVNHLAQAAAIASLQAEDELQERVETVIKERSRVRESLLSQGWTVPPTEANFVWLRLGERTMEFAAKCAAAGVAVRPFDGEGARISIGDREANDVFLAAAEAFRHAS
ncbi:histidinol-phosphate transaminase [Microbispora bryophytorum]|uniref:Aromatic amino acid aminotransferase n=1 Tax=Microbispora bryophytorum TaxID=1460882 RepID=A0A8H9GXE7_9ACTN|nr:histidinol-phosphate transaminase [Microbispora bryophytorum]MBD3135827.1 histidinol-phosphate transaminase [Microbispora bryophytorum]TQS09976.1 histidinol-phosphate transaminase [Microbispora bryophytorum]GGN99704.1 putative phenylalanine aminotransferase [Microbispora bryophytorum]